jgi:hypothetical protein
VDTITDTGRWETVYNFRVSDYHTYFVGCDEWGFSVWAHNMCTEADVAAALTREGVDAASLNLNRTQWLAAYANLGERRLLTLALDHYLPQGTSPAVRQVIQGHLEGAAAAPLSRGRPAIPVNPRPNGGIEVGDPSHRSNLPYFEEMRSVAPHEGLFDVVGHGMPDRLGSFDPHPLTAAELAQVIRDAPGYSAGQPVRLLSCWSGAFEHGFAPQLARELGVEVTAANSQVFASMGTAKLTRPTGLLGQRVGSPVFRVFDSSGGVVHEFIY